MRPLAILIALVLSLGVAACGGDGGGEDGYPNEAVSNFMNSCTAQQGATEAACRCVIDELERTMPFEEFEETDKALREKRRPAASSQQKLTRAVQKCRIQP